MIIRLINTVYKGGKSQKIKIIFSYECFNTFAEKKVRYVYIYIV